MTDETVTGVLRAFTDHQEPIPAETLAKRSSSTIEAVQEAITILEAAGFEFDRTERGYAITTVPGYGLGVQYGLSAPFQIDYHDRLPSTNDRARDLVDTTTGEWAVLADEQTGGRGRRDRAWTSPTGGIWCSVLLRSSLSPNRVSLLTLAAAVAVTDAVSELGVAATIKWPNDVIAPDGRKLAGILVETATTGGGVAWAIVGIGLNAAVDPSELPAEATSVQAYTDAIDRRTLTQSILEQLDTRRRQLDTIPAAWRERTTTLDHRVRIDLDCNSTLVGTAVDIDETGALLLETEEGRHTVTVGDCEHLRPV